MKQFCADVYIHVVEPAPNGLHVSASETGFRGQYWRRAKQHSGRGKWQLSYRAAGGPTLPIKAARTYAYGVSTGAVAVFRAFLNRGARRRRRDDDGASAREFLTVCKKSAFIYSKTEPAALDLWRRLAEPVHLGQLLIPNQQIVRGSRPLIPHHHSNHQEFPIFLSQSRIIFPRQAGRLFCQEFGAMQFPVR
jgi:hypothetical protein